VSENRELEHNAIPSSSNKHAALCRVNGGEITNLALVVADRVGVFRASVIISAQHFSPIRIILNPLCDLTWILKAAGPTGLRWSAGTAAARRRCKLEPHHAQTWHGALALWARAAGHVQDL